MTDVPFDTMAALRRLEAKGFSSEQAEAITITVREGVTGGVATKADIAELRAEIAELRAETASRELRLVLAVAAMIGLATAVLGFLIRLPV